MALTYAEFKIKYQSGYGFATSTKLKDAYRQYQLTGTLPGGAITTKPTPTTTTTPTYTGLTPEQIAWAEEHHPGVSIGGVPGYNPAAMSWAEYIKLLEAGGYSTTGLTEPGVAAPTSTPTPTVEEQIDLMPVTPTPVTPALAPAPTVTPAPKAEAPVVPTMPAVTPTPTILPTEVSPAPEYAPTEEERAWAEMYGGTIADIIKARGEGIPEETINLMIRQTTQSLNAREDENLRIMHNNMERRGITESGLVFWNQQKIKSATTTALANSITDIQVKSALMKMASFENALGQAGQFLGYLQEQSKMVYVGKMATWEAQTQANLIHYQAQISADMDQWKMVNQFNLADWQANTQSLFAKWDKNSTATIEAWKMKNVFSMEEWKTRANYDMAVFQIKTEALMAKWSAQMDIYKLGISQAYMQDNMILAGDIATDAAEQQHIDNLEIAQMEIDAAQGMAEAEAGGAISGSIVTGIFGLLGAII